MYFMLLCFLGVAVFYFWELLHTVFGSVADNGEVAVVPVVVVFHWFVTFGSERERVSASFAPLSPLCGEMEQHKKPLNILKAILLRNLKMSKVTLGQAESDNVLIGSTEVITGTTLPSMALMSRRQKAK